MFRNLTLSLALALSAASLPALADEPQRTPPPPAHAEPAATFPLPAGVFRDRIEKRMDKERGRVEKRIAAKSLAPPDAERARADVNAKIARVEALVARVTSDGKVTKEEAREVHHAIQTLFPHPKTANKHR